MKTDDLMKHACASRTGDGVCRSRGGESCAFDGAMIVLQCIADAAHVVHGPIACLGNSWESRGTVSDKGRLHRRAFTTDLNELDIIHGAGEKLMEALRLTRKDCSPRAIFVYSTCVTGLMGEDMDGLCRRAAEELGIPVIPVNTPGFIGPKNLGNRIAGQALLEHVIGTGEPERLSGTDVNLMGEYNIAGDLAHIEPLLEGSGIRLLSRITGNSRYLEITQAHRARLNVMVCSRALINVAREMESRYGIPFVEVSFFGPTQIRRALTRMGESLGRDNPGLEDRIEGFLRVREARLQEELKRFQPLKGCRAVLYTGGVKSWAIISALQDLGIEVAAVGTKKSTAEDEEKMRELLGPEVPLVENMNAGNIRNLMKAHGARLLVAGGRNRYLAAKEGFAFVDVNQERHRAYAGYEGFLNFAADIRSALAFYAPRSSATTGTSPEKNMRSVLSINPLRHSPAIGAALALQGMDRAVAVIHGAQGCNFLGKVLLTKHFMEPIAMASTRLFSEDVVMGATQKLEDTVRDIADKQAPDLIGVITTSLSEVSGEPFLESRKNVDPESPLRVQVALPDYAGGLQEGYRSVVEALAREACPRPRQTNRVNLIVGHHHTPADVEEMVETVRAFGLESTVFPDLSCLDGSREGFSGLASGGTSLADLRRLGGAALSIVVGRSLEKAARIIEERAGVPWCAFDGLMGAASVDRFLSVLSDLSGRTVPVRYLRHRRRLTDGMRDAAAELAGRTAVMALERDAALALAPLLEDMSMENRFTVIPWSDGSASEIHAAKVVVGDYEGIDATADVLISGSHGEMTAERLGMHHCVWGFPVFDTLGYNHRVHVGYQGTLNVINTLGNLLSGGRR